MARLTLACYTSAEGLGECQLSPLCPRQGPQLLSKLELLKNEYQERALREKEQKMLKLLTHQQERISQRITGSRTQQPPDEKVWASNWTVTKRTAGVDRAHLLKPVYPHRQPKVYRCPSASAASIKPSLPHVRSKSGPSRPDQWQELEKSEMILEAEIRRKEALLREKLRRTEEELRRIQKEKEESEWKERKAREVQDTKTKSRRTKLEEGDSGGMKRATKDRTEKATKINPLSIEHYKGGRERATKDSYPPIDLYSGSRERATTHSAHSINKYSLGRMKAEEDSGLSIVESRQQYGGGRGVSHPAVTQVEDTFHQLRLEAPGVQDIGRPSSGLVDEEILLYGSFPENTGQPLVQCQLCGRRFMSHRLQKHAAVCQKTHGSSRKVFDSSKARAKGTDLEPYLHKKGNRTSPMPQVRDNSWRQKHESFLRTIRQARVVQDVIAKGGRISDLPPPPPEENPDYVSCPHCSRRFAPRAAERHIPKCETIRSKPRPPPSRRL
ncbi:zinc finger C2HC domain-containing protein 1C [Dendrobates tinctorius]|uniref:zinc finger C2HC domain-containing protein 1C n=1 Tax=Dendrobates tinctorius TaxID=92724 RepID=UPI003CCA49E2